MTSKKKIIVASAVFPPEPVVSASLSFDIATELTRQGAEVEVLSPRPSRPLGFSFPKSRTKHPFKHTVVDSFVCPESKLWGRFKESYSFGKALSKHIKEHHDEINVIYAVIWPIFAQWLMARTAKRYHIPYCLHIQDVYPESYCQKVNKWVGRLLKALFLPMDRYVLRHATKVIAISPSEADYLSVSRGLDKRNVSVVRNWQDDELFARYCQPISAHQHKRRFMYLGSINPTADLEFVIRAFSHVDASETRLSVIGNGSSRKHCEELAMELGTDVEFGRVPRNEVPLKQREADVLILSLKKGIAKTATPSKLTAYLYSGRPIIACVDLDSDSAEIIRDSKSGIVVEPGNGDALLEAISKMNSYSIEQLNQMGKDGFDFAMKELSRRENLSKITQLLLSCME
ncbi:MAG: glycosyltransferase family 4 protein [Prevotella sp.]|nr:glycosyltransferase family 4 protein [Prevotella sp.]